MTKFKFSFSPPLLDNGKFPADLFQRVNIGETVAPRRHAVSAVVDGAAGTPDNHCRAAQGRIVITAAKENTGRPCYERIVSVFKKIKKIPGGGAVAADMKAQYKIKYKNRPAMMEILAKK
jgi:hypothetical protein